MGQSALAIVAVGLSGFDVAVLVVLVAALAAVVGEEEGVDLGLFAVVFPNLCKVTMVATDAVGSFGE